MDKCQQCGEALVCPKCETLVQRDSLMICARAKGPGNGGYPNQLIIVPIYKTGKGSNYSAALLIGDNFFRKLHIWQRSGTVEDLAASIINSDMQYLSGKFDLSKSQGIHFLRLQIGLQEFMQSHA